MPGEDVAASRRETARGRKICRFAAVSDRQRLQDVGLGADQAGGGRHDDREERDEQCERDAWKWLPTPSQTMNNGASAIFGISWNITMFG